MPGLLYACFYDDEWHLSVPSYISVENYDANIKFLQPTKNILYFSYLAQLDLAVSQKDETWLHKVA